MKKLVPEDRIRSYPYNTVFRKRNEDNTEYRPLVVLSPETCIELVVRAKGINQLLVAIDREILSIVNGLATDTTIGELQKRRKELELEFVLICNMFESNNSVEIISTGYKGIPYVKFDKTTYYMEDGVEKSNMEQVRIPYAEYIKYYYLEI